MSAVIVMPSADASLFAEAPQVPRPGTTAPEDRVSRRVKVAYALGTGNDTFGHWLYPGIAYPVFNIYLGVAPNLVGLALALIRLVDAVSDPLFGWLSDNTRSRFGRRRPFILIGSILAGTGLPLLFFPPGSWHGVHLFWWMLLSNFLYLPLISCFNACHPTQSLGVELTPDYHERTSVMAFKSAISKLFEIANFAALPFTNLWLFRTTGQTASPTSFSESRSTALSWD